MARELDFQRVKITISNHFEGPNFVNGLAKQDASYTVVSDTRARLEFAGGFDSDVTYVQIVSGTGFGIDANGRYTGVVESYIAFEKGNRANGWSFENLDTSLDRLNTLASDPGVSFEDLLLIPLEYEFVGAQFDDVFICRVVPVRPDPATTRCSARPARTSSSAAPARIASPRALAPTS